MCSILLSATRTDHSRRKTFKKGEKDSQLRKISLSEYCDKSQNTQRMVSTSEPPSVSVSAHSYAPVKSFMINGNRSLSLCSSERRSNLGATVSRSASKSDYFRKGVKIPINNAPNSPTCPLTALHILFDRYPAAPESPLFKRTFDPFSREYLVRTIRRPLLDAGINPSGFSGHSLRRGAAVSVVTAGIPRDDIKTLGRWKSDSVDLYFES
jgi:hypothetical protein